MAGLGFGLESVKISGRPRKYIEVITEISKMIPRQLVSIRNNAESDEEFEGYVESF